MSKRRRAISWVLFWCVIFGAPIIAVCTSEVAVLGDGSRRPQRNDDDDLIIGSDGDTSEGEGEDAGVSDAGFVLADAGVLAPVDAGFFDAGFADQVDAGFGVNGTCVPPLCPEIIISEIIGCKLFDPICCGGVVEVFNHSHVDERLDNYALVKVVPGATNQIQPLSGTVNGYSRAVVFIDRFVISCSAGDEYRLIVGPAHTIIDRTTLQVEREGNSWSRLLEPIDSTSPFLETRATPGAPNSLP